MKIKIADDKLTSLLKDNYLSEYDLSTAAKVARDRGVTLAEYLLAENLLSKDLLGQAIAEYYKVPYADLNTNIPRVEQLMRIPEDLARRFRVVLFEDSGDKIVVATDRPDAADLIMSLTKIFPAKKITIAFAMPDDVENALLVYRRPLSERLARLIKAGEHVGPIVISEVLKEAIDLGASDIHFEPRGEIVVLRLRVDGVLREVGSLPKKPYEDVVNRIKVAARLRIDEHQAIQDGAMRLSRGGGSYDLRVSIAPTVEGEKVVMRVLSQYTQKFSLTNLGMPESRQKLLLDAAGKPFGMILVAGPTGAGKTTTLYALVKLLNREEANISTIEDPVEYKITGVNHIQVNSAAGLTFATGLRSIMRQDPDIILVGEIRDEETAQISVNAALTGHLLLSTVHANDAATAIPRLLDMKTEPFLLSSTLELIIAQRLLRTICDRCRYSYVASDKRFGLPNNLYKGKGCEACGGSGYRGRTAAFELIVATPELKKIMLNNPSTSDIWKLARSQGAISMFEDGLEKVAAGLTTLEELLRVAAPPSGGGK